MSTDREATLPIEDWDGVNLNVDSEDIQPTQLLMAENLWEKTLGQLETRWGSETSLYKPSPIDNRGLGNITKLYKSWGEKKRFCAVKCTPDVQVLGSLPSGVALSFVTNAASYWNKDNTFVAGTESGVTLSFTHRRLMVRFVGYGVDHIYMINVPSVSGYVADTKQYLNVVVTGATFDRTKYTGFEIYATVASGSTQTVATITDTSAYQEQTMWVGFVDCTGGVDQTKIFRYAPGGYDSTIAGGTTIGATERSFACRAYETGNNGITGYLQGGKTYYVAVLPQYAVFGTGTASRMCYRQPTADVFGGEIVPITIPGTTTGYIVLETLDPNTTTFMIAVGDTPQTLQPYGIFNDSESGFYAGLEDSGPPTQVPPTGGGYFGINKIKPGNPGVIDLTYTADGVATLSFRFSDYSRSDMFMCINDDGTSVPIFAGRLHEHVNSATEWQDVVSNPAVDPISAGAVSRYNWYYYGINNPDQVQRLGSGARYQYASWDNYILLVNDFDPLSLSAKTASGTPTLIPVIPSKTNTNYFICDGLVAAAVIEDFQTTKVTLPNMKYIAKFDGSVVMGGGTKSIDPENGGLNDSSKQVYFSRADNPFDFTIAGAASTVHQVIDVDNDGENISGFGIYTNTTSDQGPLSQLFVLKKSATWIMNSLPTNDSGSLINFTNRLLSKKVGGFHSTVINTPIGAIMAGADNVYLLREDGEPTPIGQCIAPLLKASNMSKAVACYHDKHYKLAFSCPLYPGSQNGDSNNVEMWLNINKVIEKKGGEDWVGPMTGRAVDFTFVEDKDEDGIAYDTSRDRYCIDKYTGNGRVYIADVMPEVTDEILYDLRTADGDATNTPVQAVIESKDLEITPQDNNWTKLIKRFYIKSRQNFVKPDAQNYAWYKLFVDGEDATGLVPFDFAATAGTFYSKPLKLFGVVPQVSGVTVRLNGRTVRLHLEFTHRIGLGGFQVNYQVNRRRV